MASRMRAGLRWGPWWTVAAVVILSVSALTPQAIATPTPEASPSATTTASSSGSSPASSASPSESETSAASASPSESETPAAAATPSASETPAAAATASATPGSPSSPVADNSGATPTPAAAAVTAGSVSPPPAVVETLPAGALLPARGTLVSPAAGYRLVLQDDGNLVVYTSADVPVWWSATVGSGASLLAVQGDGNLVLYTAAGTPVWWSGTAGSGATRLVMQGDGNLVLYDIDRPVWASQQGFLADRMTSGKLMAGRQLFTNDGAYRLVMQEDGNLVGYDAAGQYFWTTATGGSGATWLAMQTDGNLVLYTAAGVAVWSSGRAGYGPSALVMQTDRNIVTYANWQPTWWTGTAWYVQSNGVTASDVWASYRAGCPVVPSQLVRISFPFWNMQGTVEQGTVVLAASAAGAVIETFRQAFWKHFPFRLITPIDAFGGSDISSMAADNTSAFNCRTVTGNPRQISQHSYGNAIDFNPYENPYVTTSTVYPIGSDTYLSRSVIRPGMITQGGVIEATMTGLGWYWGTRFATPDYQHFSSNGG